jgi:hypothetical protein
MMSRNYVLEEGDSQDKFERVVTGQHKRTAEPEKQDSRQQKCVNRIPSVRGRYLILESEQHRTLPPLWNRDHQPLPHLPRSRLNSQRQPFKIE